MNREQEEKYREWLNNGGNTLFARDVWQACLEANGIEEESEKQPSVVSDWVLEMMRTGKPVKCICWQTDPKKKTTAMVYGYAINSVNSYFADDGYCYVHAEPIPVWQPKVGEAIFYENFTITHVAKVIAVHDGYCTVIGSEGIQTCANFKKIKPFDPAKIGLPFEEI